VTKKGKKNEKRGNKWKGAKKKKLKKKTKKKNGMHCTVHWMWVTL
jgi:hypothetical protein